MSPAALDLRTMAPKSLRVLNLLVRCRGRIVSPEMVLDEVGEGRATDERLRRRRAAAHVSFVRAFLRAQLGDELVEVVRRDSEFVGYTLSRRAVDRLRKAVEG